MNVRSRRILYISAILFFIVISPLLIYYAQGYRIDFGTRSVVRIGCLSVYSLPRSATITVDGKTLSATTPAQDIDLKPGSYNISVQKDGYLGWSTAIRVQQANTVTLDATLVPRRPTARYQLQGTISAFAPFMNDQQIAIIRSVDSTGTFIELYDVETGALRRLAELSKSTVLSPTLTWSLHGKYIALVDASLFMIIKTDDATVPFLTTESPPDSMLWATTSDNVFYTVESGSVIEYDLLTHKERTILSPHVQTIAVDNSTVWAIAQENQHSILYSVPLTGSSDITTSAELPSSPVSLFKLFNDTLILGTRSLTYMYNVRTTTMTQLSVSSPLYATDNDNGDSVLITTATELWSVQLKNITSSLIARLSSIDSALAYPGNRPVSLVLTDGKIRAFDLNYPSAISGAIDGIIDPLGFVHHDPRSAIIVEKQSIDIVRID